MEEMHPLALSACKASTRLMRRQYSKLLLTLTGRSDQGRYCSYSVSVVVTSNNGTVIRQHRKGVTSCEKSFIVARLRSRNARAMRNN